MQSVYRNYKTIEEFQVKNHRRIEGKAKLETGDVFKQSSKVSKYNLLDGEDRDICFSDFYQYGDVAFYSRPWNAAGLIRDVDERYIKSLQRKLKLKIINKKIA